ncbi:MAG: SpoIID/LytB domain-containing protein [Candidatus Azobacteroides sp.]|nr:SpoIID/LytB domain-containing protein [Candidatus Azobacteroides sp.]
MTQAAVRVGILTGKEIAFIFTGNYSLSGVEITTGHFFSVRYDHGEILFQGKKYKELLFKALNREAAFLLQNVTIGVTFHWERKVDQLFSGDLKIILSGETVTAVNIVPVEDYLVSVISSEMSSTASPEFLKAHAVISRGWLLAQINKNKPEKTEEISFSSLVRNDNEYIRWYDREDHELFDVCADDHCQRYQGISHILSPKAEQAVHDTCGQVLTYDHQICDTRFSKCCGGMTEEFQSCWEPVKHPYLIALPDKNPDSGESVSDLSDEDHARIWIESSPEAFCNTSDETVLKQVLKDYDRETTSFYRWKVEYDREELAGLISRRSGIDFGTIIDLIPVERGKSGRLVKLKIVGTRKTLIVGKELEIRRILSESHLYSSAFIIEKESITDHLPQKFILRGAGWGHGVGLCQIGAAVMGEKGYRYDEILRHYFPGTTIEKRY